MQRIHYFPELSKAFKLSEGELGSGQSKVEGPERLWWVPQRGMLKMGWGKQVPAFIWSGGRSLDLLRLPIMFPYHFSSQLCDSNVGRRTDKGGWLALTAFRNPWLTCTFCLEKTQCHCPRVVKDLRRRSPRKGSKVSLSFLSEDAG